MLPPHGVWVTEATLPTSTFRCCAQVQLISIPQLDAIQRCLKLLDVRLQHVQSSARDDDRTRDDVGHIRKLMNENQKALSTVVTVLDSIQEEVSGNFGRR